MDYHGFWPFIFLKVEGKRMGRMRQSIELTKQITFSRIKFFEITHIFGVMAERSFILRPKSRSVPKPKISCNQHKKYQKWNQLSFRPRISVFLNILTLFDFVWRKKRIFAFWNGPTFWAQGQTFFCHNSKNTRNFKKFYSWKSYSFGEIYRLPHSSHSLPFHFKDLVLKQE